MFVGASKYHRSSKLLSHAYFFISFSLRDKVDINLNLMKLFFVSLFLFSAFTSFSQCKIGYTKSDIIKEYSSLNKIVEIPKSDTDRYIMVRLDNEKVMYFFDGNNVCYMSSLFPKDTRTLNALTKKYNSDFTPIANNEWKMSCNNGITTVKLYYEKDGSYYFAFFIRDGK